MAAGTDIRILLDRIASKHRDPHWPVSTAPRHHMV